MPSPLSRLEVWGDESGNLDFDPLTGSTHGRSGAAWNAMTIGRCI